MKGRKPSLAARIRAAKTIDEKILLARCGDAPELVVAAFIYEGLKFQKTQGFEFPPDRLQDCFRAVLYTVVGAIQRKDAKAVQALIDIWKGKKQWPEIPADLTRHKILCEVKDRPQQRLTLDGWVRKLNYIGNPKYLRVLLKECRAKIRNRPFRPRRLRGHARALQRWRKAIEVKSHETAAKLTNTLETSLKDSSSKAV